MKTRYSLLLNKQFQQLILRVNWADFFVKRTKAGCDLVCYSVLMFWGLEQ
ncbi:hypothetical protein SFB21_1404 [Acinetobacter bouvetii]|uniref:Uncharacterized protein n=1 Tax=Acinetobacter bouvetii TaxID=202951 RepID=A0A811GCM2_9GAMM|nr:hypothetical protein SFB21_1404 [Acinetobacter bouvetii]